MKPGRYKRPRVRRPRERYVRRNVQAMANFEKPFDRIITSFHESGHCVISVVNGEAFNYVTVVKNKITHAKGWIDHYGCEVIHPPEVHVLSTLAARHAQRRHAPRSDWRGDSRNDWDEAVSYLRRKKVRGARIYPISRRSRMLVKKHWLQIHKVAVVLMMCKTMDENAVRAVMQWPPRPRPVRVEPDTEWFEYTHVAYEDSCLVD